ncbi:hypothetical protein FHS85_002337 [Rhodoligotrophos appendicifer]|uniref:hypothetical protein n=1 Tax=Rhodoligotrophos appendicifer TaxID=987056 RepID=UPI00118579D8|nr:hypothetical protein [Rhodoligotrophos appendicifer]
MLPALLAILLLLSAVNVALAQKKPTKPSLVDSITRNATLKDPGQAMVAGQPVRCGGSRTLISPHFYDYGGAMKGLIILNPRKLARLPRVSQLFVFAHECGHQHVGQSESRADCFAVQQGKTAGWLKERDIGTICASLFSNSRGDEFHAPGPKRCSMLKACYRDAKPSRVQVIIGGSGSRPSPSFAKRHAE